MNYRDLSAGWQLKQRNAEIALNDDFVSADTWIAASVPGVVQLDLLAAGKIPAPFEGLNETQLQWIGECDWLYRTTFSLTAEDLAHGALQLCFDGLDTYATVWLNDTQILQSDNMFVPYRLDVKALLQEGNNELHILFESALLRGKELEEQNGGKLPLWNGDSSRLYVRKAQYHYGWDWGPIFMTAGPWRAIHLEAYEVRIADVHCPYEVAEDLSSALLPIHVQIENGERSTAAELSVALYNPAGVLVAEQTVPVQSERTDVQLTLEQVELWWPHGYGEQPLYRLETIVRDAQGVLDQHSLVLGLRRLGLIQHALQDEPGSSFYFEINNTPIFCGGANWIPADSFTTSIDRARYRQWLQLAVDGNMTMLRVWGGGIFEDATFYELCDEMGILIWQDFLFGCGIYPAVDWFKQSVRTEAEANVRLLRHHPSIVLWCGNNEDYAIAGPKYDPTVTENFEETAFPARVIYEQILPQVCAQLDPTRPYWPGSPFGHGPNHPQGSKVDDTTVGDTHVWTVWHGGVAYQDYYKLAGRFVSEFGMEAFPVMETIKEFAPESEWYPQSRTLDFHNKDAGGPRRLAPYIVDNVRVAADLPGYIYNTQFIQSEALGSAIRGWRRRWQGPGREYTAGALVWQLNDCWPVTSWAVVDYYLRPKPAYYTIKRELARYAVGLAQHESEPVHAWAVNGEQREVQFELELRTWNLAGELLDEQSQTIVLPPNQASELATLSRPQGENWVMQARLLKDKAIVARATLWPEPFKYLSLPDPEIEIEQIDENSISVTAKRPAKGVWLNAPGNLTWSDNMLDVLPNDPQIIQVKGYDASSVEITWLGK
ncbi:beta-mannosidase [Dictyobacter arantiisoli]|uniref:beta-mannosidase n=1 Tax=Dictyobacter arantiisoli TaxID=2014874 RepID=UPI001F36F1DC|nr:glycoside hydrolase family 2 protein [Dictyobacter arantiisoli]